MAGRANHLRQARANFAHAEWLLHTARSDPICVQWAVTVAFYSALHCIEAHLADRGIHCDTHFQRQRTLREPRAAIPRGARIQYHQLKDWSEQARYYLRQFRPEMVEQTILNQHLREVTSFVGL
jgi:hypothetical protein